MIQFLIPTLHFLYETDQTVADTDEYESFFIKLDTGGTWVTNGTGVIGLRVLFVIAAGANVDNATGRTWANFAKATSNQVNGVAATSDRFRIRNVKLELGTVSTPYEYEDDGVSLRKCQRYLWKTFDQDTAPAQSAGLTGALTRIVSSAGAVLQGLDLNLPVPMASTATPTFSNPSAANTKWRNVTDGGDSGAPALRNFGERGGGIDHTQVAGDAIGEECAIHVLLDARL